MLVNLLYEWQIQNTQFYTFNWSIWLNKRADLSFWLLGWSVWSSFPTFVLFLFFYYFGLIHSKSFPRRVFFLSRKIIKYFNVICYKNLKWSAYLILRYYRPTLMFQLLVFLCFCENNLCCSSFSWVWFYRGLSNDLSKQLEVLQFALKERCLFVFLKRNILREQGSGQQQNVHSTDEETSQCFA